MQIKQTLKIISILPLLVLFFWAWMPTPVAAQECGGDCSVAQCGSYCTYDPDGNCIDNPIYCTACGGSGCENVLCPPGQYWAGGQCHDIADGGCECGTKADGSGCKPCGGNACNADDYGRVNCGPGETKTNTVVSGPLCVNENNLKCIGGGSIEAGLGSAQGLGGCCADRIDPDTGDVVGCKAYDVWTYSCCPAGTENVVTGSSSYTRLNDCRSPTICNNSYDTYVSHTGAPQTIENRCYRGDDPNDSSYREWFYDVITTCSSPVYTCVPVCTAPTAPTLSSPANGAQLSTTSVGLYWNAVTFGAGCSGSYKVYVGTSNPPTTLHATVDSTTTNTNFTGTRATTYYWYVRAENGGVGTNSEIRNFTILDNQITGQVFYDPNNSCGGSGWSSGGVSVSVDGGAGTAVDGTGVYSAAAAVGASHTLEVNIPANFACSTGAGCNTCARSGIGSPSANNNFYLTDSRESWWQAEGAGIYAGGIGGVRSILPSSSLRLILAPVGGTEGLLMTSTGTVDIGDVGSVSDSGWRAISRYRGKKMDFDYFAANMGVVRGQDSDWQSDTMNLQADDGRDFWYMDPVGSTATIGAGSPWLVAGGDKHVIFVNGNLDINSDIVVAPGSFLALIVKGDMTVDPSVANLEGLYVIDGSFVTETAYVEGVIDDIQLETGGTIVAWGSLSLSRSLGTGNITVPAEKFVYRSDLLTNMPDKMKTFVMQWNEVVPGTFNE